VSSKNTYQTNLNFSHLKKSSITNYPEVDIARESLPSSEIFLKESKSEKKEEINQNREKVNDKNQFQQMAKDLHNSRRQEMYRRNRKDRNVPQQFKTEFKQSGHTKGDKDIQSK
jgi:hypothetical protein